MTTPAGCCYCGTTDRELLRPYGPGGADVCFRCMLETPERQNEAKRQFKARLAAGPVAILTDRGPRKMPGGGSA